MFISQTRTGSSKTDGYGYGQRLYVVGVTPCLLRDNRLDQPSQKQLHSCNAVEKTEAYKYLGA
jgi:hypothetical protein